MLLYYRALAEIDGDSTADYLSKITSHDYYTYTHSVNVGMLSILLAKKCVQRIV